MFPPAPDRSSGSAIDTLKTGVKFSQEQSSSFIPPPPAARNSYTRLLRGWDRCCGALSLSGFGFRALGLHLLRRPHSQLGDPQDGVFVLALHMLDMPIPPLRLLLHPHRLALHTYDLRPAYEQPVVQVVDNGSRALPRTLDGCGSA